MRINLGFNESDLETFDCTFSIYFGETLAKQERMTAPRMMIEQRFIDYMQQSARAVKPIRLLLARKEVIWNQYTQRNEEKTYTIEYANPAYIDRYGELKE